MIVRENTVKSSIPANFRDMYVVRCIKETFGMSKKGLPMITLVWEIIGKRDLVDGEYQIKDTITRNGEQYMIAGQQITSYHSLSEKAIGMFFEFEDKLGFDTKSVDETNPPLHYKGICAYMILKGTETIQRMDPTPEQIENGELGTPILGPDGQEIKSTRAEIHQVLGRCDPDTETLVNNTKPF